MPQATKSDAKIPQRYEKASIGDFPPNIGADCARPASVFIFGKAGVGKTHLAAAIALDRVSHYEIKTCQFDSTSSKPVLWTTCSKLLMEIRATFGKKDGPTELSIVRKYSECDLLILDDFGAEKVTDWSISALYVILNDRIDYLRETVVTSNFTLAEIDSFDPRMASRLAGFQQIRLEGRDRRLSK